MKTKKTTRIMVIAAFLAIVTAGAPLFAGGKQDASGPMETKTVPVPVPEPVPQAALKELEKVHTVTAADFKTVTVADDGSSVSLENYTGSAQNIMIPAELEGLPVKSVNVKGNETIRSVTIAEGFTAFDSFFQGCTSLTSVTLPKGIKKIEERMFRMCKSLTSLTIPAGVTEIGDDAFYGSGIKELVIPGSVRVIGSTAFRSSDIKEMVIPDSVTEFGRYLFDDSAIERVTLPKGLKEIPETMFYHCKNLKSITLPEGLTAIGSLAFSGSGLQSIVIPDSVTKIGGLAFLNCKNLTEVTMPRNLKDLEIKGFNGCSSLKRIVIPAGVKKIEGSFTDCTALEEIAFEGNLEIVEGKHFDEIVRPFYGCKNIKKLNAGPGVTKIKGLRYIPGPNVEGLPLKEQAELKAAWSAFMAKYGGD